MRNLCNDIYRWWTRSKQTKEFVCGLPRELSQWTEQYRPKALQEILVRYTRRSSTKAAVADDFGGHALHDFEVTQRTIQQGKVIMRMDINKAGRDDTTCRINRLCGITAHRTDRYDTVVLNANISSKSRLAT